MAALSSFVAVVATPAQRASRPRARAVSHSHVRCGQKSEASAAAAPSAPSGVLSRRNLLASGALIASGAVQLPAFAAGADVDWASLKKDIISVIADPKAPGGVGDKGPTLVRLAWHSSGTYDRISKTGGSGQGTIRFKEELAHGGNAGLVNAVGWLEPLKKKHPGVSYADLYTYAGVVSVEAMGGPAVPFRFGRVDAMDPSAVTPDGRLPEADRGNPMATAKGLRDVFYRMGFNDQEIVALSGAHALGRCHADYSGYVGPWQGTPTIFSNIYYKLLLKAGKDGKDYWVPDPRTKQFQYQDPSGTLMMLPSDIVLIQDAKFEPWVQKYAKDKALFYGDFSKAFQKLEELGTKGLKPLPTA